MGTICLGICTEHGIEFTDNTPTLPLLRKNDICLMEAFMSCSKIPQKHWKIINQCRLFLRAFSLSDISTGDGRHISHNAWSGIYVEDTGRDGEAWPLIGTPTTADWKIWREALRLTFCSRRINLLDSPLGSWIGNAACYTWFICSNSRLLLHKTKQGWFSHSPATSRPRNIRFKHQQDPVTGVDVNKLTPTTVTKDKNWITIEGLTQTKQSQTSTTSLSLFTAPNWLYHTYNNHNDVDPLIASLQNGTAIAVSDGSYSEELGLGGSASILSNPATTSAIQVTSLSPGLPTIQSAYRSELVGILASFQLIYDICKKYKITSGKCTIICDGKGALMKAFSITMNSLRSSTEHSDILAPILKLRRAIPINLIPQHVKSHQDEIKQFSDLTEWEKLNVLMDKHAKHTVKTNPYSHHQLSQLPHHDLSFQSVSYDGIVQRYNITSTLYSSLYEHKVLAYWNRENRFEHNQNTMIDWESQQRARKETPGSQKRFISKWSTNYIGTGENMIEWNLRCHGDCPFCNEPKESTTHVLQCLHTDSLQAWSKEMEIYKTNLTKIGTSTILVKVILTELHCWRNKLSYPDVTCFSPELQGLIRAQRNLGWKNFLEGILSTRWREMQQRYRSKKYTHSRSQLWSKRLIKINWALLSSVWLQRNEQLHNTQAIYDREGHKELLRAIDKEWKIGLNQLPIRDFAYLFQLKWKHLKRRTTSYLKGWFAKVRLGRELYKDNKLLIDEFSEEGPLRQWAGLQTKNINETELEKSLKRENRLGLSLLSEGQYGYLFEIKDIHTQTHTLDQKKEWLKTVKKAREDINDPNLIIDIFSVEGPLRKWIGLSK